MNRFYKAALLLLMTLIGMHQPLYSFNFETVKSSIINYIKPNCIQEKIVKIACLGALVGITVFGVYSYLKYRYNGSIGDKDYNSKEGHKNGFSDHSVTTQVDTLEKEEDSDSKEEEFSNRPKLNEIEQEILGIIPEIEEALKTQQRINERRLNDIIRLERTLKWHFNGVDDSANLTIKLTHFQDYLQALRLDLKRYNDKSAENFTYNNENAEKITKTCESITKFLTEIEE